MFPKVQNILRFLKHWNNEFKKFQLSSIKKYYKTKN